MGPNKSVLGQIFFGQDKKFDFLKNFFSFDQYLRPKIKNMIHLYLRGIMGIVMYIVSLPLNITRKMMELRCFRCIYWEKYIGDKQWFAVQSIQY